MSLPVLQNRLSFARGRDLVDIVDIVDIAGMSELGAVGPDTLPSERGALLTQLPFPFDQRPMTSSIMRLAGNRVDPIGGGP